jgi:hypothetical protein
LWRLSGRCAGAAAANGRSARTRPGMTLSCSTTTSSRLTRGSSATPPAQASQPSDQATRRPSARRSRVRERRRPLAPVHGVVRQSGTGGLTLTWVRRARGAWGWHDAVDVPLNEDEERWTIGYGDAATPAVRWETGVAMLDLSSAQAESPRDGRAAPIPYPPERARLALPAAHHFPTGLKRPFLYDRSTTMTDPTNFASITARFNLPLPMRGRRRRK